MKPQILVVDDDESILRLIGFMLSKEFDLIFKRNALDAFSWLEEGNNPALVITDLQMPHIDGITFLKNLKISGYYRHLPSIVLSGDEELANKLRETDFEFDDYMEKPFNPIALRAKVVKLLDKYTKRPTTRLSSHLSGFSYGNDRFEKA